MTARQKPDKEEIGSLRAGGQALRPQKSRPAPPDAGRPAFPRLPPCTLRSAAKHAMLELSYPRKEPTMQDEAYLVKVIGKQKNIALIAHDNKKAELIEWCRQHKDVLARHFLCGTGTTARMITQQTDLPVRGYNSGPLGGDQQIGAKIVEGRIDMVIFFSDPLTAQPHDPDVKALLRIAQVYDIPIANNRATADFLLASRLMDSEYTHRVINFHKSIRDRSETL